MKHSKLENQSWKMRSWTEQLSSHVREKKKAAKKKSHHTRVAFASHPVTLTACLSHTSHNRLTSSWVGSLNKKSKLRWERGIVNFYLAVTFQSPSAPHIRAP